jgi:hypothetical protein
MNTAVMTRLLGSLELISGLAAAFDATIFAILRKRSQLLRKRSQQGKSEQKQCCKMNSATFRRVFAFISL